DDPSARPKPPRERAPAKGKSDGPEAGDLPQATELKVVNKSRPPKALTELGDAPDLPRAEPTELQQRLRAAEDRFLALEGPLAAPERQALWPEMAALNAALGQGDEAGACWTHALWAEDGGTAGTLAWFLAEASAVAPRPEPGLPRGRSWASAVTLQ